MRVLHLTLCSCKFRQSRGVAKNNAESFSHGQTKKRAFEKRLAWEGCLVGLEPTTFRTTI